MMLKRALSIKSAKFALFALSFASILALALLLVFGGNFSRAESVESDLEVTVSDVLALSLVNCDASDSSTIKVDVTPSSAGTFKSACQTASVHTNAPGYTLTAKSSSSTLNYLNPTTVSPTPTIASTTSPTTSPAVLTNNTWGFAAEGRLNFNSSYAIDNASNTYAQLPTTDTTIYTDDGSIFPLPVTDHTFYYGTRLTTETMAGTYATTITYTAVGAEVPEIVIPPCVEDNYECILFTINTTDGTYSIPTSGRVANMNHAYDWDVYVDGVLTTDCPGGNCTGTSDYLFAPGMNGIVLAGLSNGTHQIKIVSHTTPTPGWGNAFGHHTSTSGANAATNKNKLITLDAPLTTMAFAPKTTESTTDASYMFSNLFNTCINLTTTIEILNTYTLPNTITNLSHFLSSAHSNDRQLTIPINLAPLKDWFYQNGSITNLASFLYNTHGANPLTAPIDLSPISNWFSNNTSITNLASFLSNTHNGTSAYNLQATDTIDLSPVSNWFNSNAKITNLSNFLANTHYNNSKLTTPISLGPLENWFVDNESIENLSGFLSSTHGINDSLTTPINLSPVSGWFNNNTSITNLSNFLSGAQRGNSINSLIDMTVLSEWFAENRRVATLSGFMSQTYYGQNGIVLTGQVVFPNWMKTMTDNSSTPVPIWDTSNSFSYTFNKNGLSVGNDTGEPKYEDGTVLSSVGTPSSRKYTYTYRTFFNYLPANWQ